MFFIKAATAFVKVSFELSQKFGRPMPEYLIPGVGASCPAIVTDEGDDHGQFG